MAYSQPISRQSGLGRATSQVGSKAIPIAQKTHFATAESASRAGGRVIQREKKCTP
jgi:hypothetical protein